MAVFNETDYDIFDTIIGTPADTNDTLITSRGLFFSYDGSINTIRAGYYSNFSGQQYEENNFLESIEYIQYSDKIVRLHTGTSADESYIGGGDLYGAFNGGQGTDTLTYAGNFADYSICALICREHPACNDYISERHARYRRSCRVCR